MEYKNLSEIISKSSKADTTQDNNFDNLLNYLTYLSNTYKHLKKFIEILTIIKKILILKSDKYDLLIPTESEINLLEQNLKNGNTMDIIAILSRLIKSKSQSFKIFLDTKYLIQKLNNGSTVYYRYFTEKKKKDKKIDESDTNLISNITMNNVIKNENYEEMYEQINSINDKLIKMFNKSDNLFVLIGINNKRTNELPYLKYIRELKKNVAIDDNSSEEESADESADEYEGDEHNKNSKLKKMNMSYRNNFFKFIIEKFYKNNKANNNYLNKIKNIMINNLNLKEITENNEFLEKTLLNLFKHQVSSIVLITSLLQPFSVVDQYVFTLKEINELNIKIILNNKVSSDNKKNNVDKDMEELSIINKIPCIKLIKKFMKDSTPYNNNSLTNLINHYYTILENKENAHKLLWLLFNIYYLECIYNEFKNNNVSTFETYARLLAVKPIKKGDAYLERLKWIIKLFEEQKNTEISLPALINFCLFVSLKEENSYLLLGDDSDFDVDDINDNLDSINNNKTEIYF
jgi:hypothetical protein